MWICLTLLQSVLSRALETKFTERPFLKRQNSLLRLFGYFRKFLKNIIFIQNFGIIYGNGGFKLQGTNNF